MHSPVHRTFPDGLDSTSGSPWVQQVCSFHQWSWRPPVRAWASLSIMCIWWHSLHQQLLRNKEETCWVLQEGVKHLTGSCPLSHKGLELRKWSVPRDTAAVRSTFSGVEGISPGFESHLCPILVGDMGCPLLGHHVPPWYNVIEST